MSFTGQVQMLSHPGRADVDKVRWFSLLYNTCTHLNRIALTHYLTHTLIWFTA